MTSEGAKRFCFYGRVSTEDNQDPKASRQWQLKRAKTLIEPVDGVIVAEYFDVGVSRSIPWRRRPEAAALLAALPYPDRGFEAVVIGEPHRAFSGIQFSLTYPVMDHYEVELWVPELGGPVDSESEMQEMMMGIFGGMSKSERNRIRVRVKTAMGEQAKDGRFLGGKPPFGYVLVDAGVHPNLEKARNGIQLHQLAIDPETAPVVKRIFDLYMAGHGYRQIAYVLNLEGDPSPTANKPNPKGWSASTVRNILRNPRYTGKVHWNRQKRVERLINPDDVGWGYTMSIQENNEEKWVVSDRQTYPEIVSAELFQAAQEAMKSRSSERSYDFNHLPPRFRPSSFMLKGMIRCDLCGRLMSGHSGKKQKRTYRCETTAKHPDKRFLVNESEMLEVLDGWLERIFEGEAAEVAYKMLADTQRGGASDIDVEMMEARSVIVDCDVELAQYREALKTMPTPTPSLSSWIAETDERRQAAVDKLAELEAAGGLSEYMTVDQIREAVEKLGGVRGVLSRCEQSLRRRFYIAVGLIGVFDPVERRVCFSVLQERIGVQAPSRVAKGVQYASAGVAKVVDDGENGGDTGCENDVSGWAVLNRFGNRNGAAWEAWEGVWHRNRNRLSSEWQRFHKSA